MNGDLTQDYIEGNTLHCNTHILCPKKPYTVYNTSNTTGNNNLRRRQILEIRKSDSRFIRQKACPKGCSSNPGSVAQPIIGSRSVDRDCRSGELKSQRPRLCKVLGAITKGYGDLYVNYQLPFIIVIIEIWNESRSHTSDQQLDK